MELIIAGTVLIVLGGGLFFFRKKSLNRALDIKYYETSPVREVLETYQELKHDLGIGNYSGNIVELKGVATSTQPLIADFSQRPVVYYENSVTREYEYTVQEKDNNGNYRTVTRRGSETVSSNKQEIPFDLEGSDGHKIRVDMRGAKKDTIESYDQFRPDAPRGINIGFGGRAGSRTIGYRYREKVIPTQVPLYILGEVSDRAGELMILKPKESGKPFIVSTKSEEELIRSAENSATLFLVLMIILIVGGLGLLIYGIIQSVSG